MASTLSEKLQDPLCETTRKQRRNLLLFSVIGIVIAKARIIPTEISALGIKFSHGDSESLLNILSWVIIYYLITYIVYSYSEFLSLRMWSLEKEEKYRREMERHAGIDESPYMYGMRGSYALRIRTYFEFFIPILISIIAVTWLFLVDPNQASQTVKTGGTTQQSAKVGPPPSSVAP